jgi:beta-phosphoglucomutase
MPSRILRFFFKEPKKLVFEDSVAGIQAANIGGMTSVGIGDEAVLNEADYVFPDFTHIDLNFIENLVNK